MAPRKKTSNHRIRINREVEPGQYALADIFPGIRSYSILHKVFADTREYDRVMKRTGVFIVDSPHVMSVDNDTGAITIGLEYLQSAPAEYLYLDIIHELCHVKQHLQGRDLYDRHKSYVDRETEIEAYEVAVQEARRIGLTESTIRDYLRVPWITPVEHRRLVRRMGCNSRPAKM
jgi:hypothetical protein